MSSPTPDQSNIKDGLDEFLLEAYQHGKNEVKPEIYLPKFRAKLNTLITQSRQEAEQLIADKCREAVVAELEGLIGGVTSEELLTQAGIQAVEGYIQFRLSELKNNKPEGLK